MTGETFFDDRLKFYACLVGRDQAHEAVARRFRSSLVESLACRR